MDAADAILAALGPDDDRRRTMADLEADAATADLVAAARRAPDELRRRLVLDVLGRRADPAAAPTLLEHLADPAPDVRAAAADALGKTALTAELDGRPDALDLDAAGRVLLDAHDAEPDPGVRTMLAAALGAVRCDAAAERLQLAFDAAEPRRRGVLGWSLERLGRPPGDRDYGGRWRGSCAAIAREVLVLLAASDVAPDALLATVPPESLLLALRDAPDAGTRAALELALARHGG